MNFWRFYLKNPASFPIEKALKRVFLPGQSMKKALRAKDSPPDSPIEALKPSCQRFFPFCSLLLNEVNYGRDFASRTEYRFWPGRYTFELSRNPWKASFPFLSPEALLSNIL